MHQHYNAAERRSRLVQQGKNIIGNVASSTAESHHHLYNNYMTPNHRFQNQNGHQFNQNNERNQWNARNMSAKHDIYTQNGSPNPNHHQQHPHVTNQNYGNGNQESGGNEGKNINPILARKQKYARELQEQMKQQQRQKKREMDLFKGVNTHESQQPLPNNNGFQNKHIGGYSNQSPSVPSCGASYLGQEEYANELAKQIHDKKHSQSSQRRETTHYQNNIQRGLCNIGAPTNKDLQRRKQLEYSRALNEQMQLRDARRFREKEANRLADLKVDQNDMNSAKIEHVISQSPQMGIQHQQNDLNNIEDRHPNSNQSFLGRNNLQSNNLILKQHQSNDHSIISSNPVSNLHGRPTTDLHHKAEQDVSQKKEIQNYLRSQIEDKKRRKEEERRKIAEEEKVELDRITKEQVELKRQFEAEKIQQRKKQEQQDTLYKQIEDKKKSAADEAERNKNIEKENLNVSIRQKNLSLYDGDQNTTSMEQKRNHFSVPCPPSTEPLSDTHPDVIHNSNRSIPHARNTNIFGDQLKSNGFILNQPVQPIYSPNNHVINQNTSDSAQGGHQQMQNLKSYNADHQHNEMVGINRPSNQHDANHFLLNSSDHRSMHAIQKHSENIYPIKEASNHLQPNQHTNRPQHEKIPISQDNFIDNEYSLNYGIPSSLQNEHSRIEYQNSSIMECNESPNSNSSFQIRKEQEALKLELSRQHEINMNNLQQLRSEMQEEMERREIEHRKELERIKNIATKRSEIAACHTDRPQLNSSGSSLPMNNNSLNVESSRLVSSSSCVRSKETNYGQVDTCLKCESTLIFPDGRATSNQDSLEDSIDFAIKDSKSKNLKSDVNHSFNMPIPNTPRTPVKMMDIQRNDGKQNRVVEQYPEYGEVLEEMTFEGNDINNQDDVLLNESQSFEDDSLAFLVTSFESQSCNDRYQDYDTNQKHTETNFDDSSDPSIDYDEISRMNQTRFDLLQSFDKKEDKNLHQVEKLLAKLKRIDVKQEPDINLGGVSKWLKPK